MTDWIGDAAKELEGHIYGEDRIKKIILKHCPLQPDTAYMSIPRCDTCRYWRPTGGAIRVKMGGCAKLLILTNSDVRIDVEADFGCVQWEAK